MKKEFGGEPTDRPNFDLDADRESFEKKRELAASVFEVAGFKIGDEVIALSGTQEGSKTEWKPMPGFVIEDFSIDRRFGSGREVPVASLKATEAHKGNTLLTTVPLSDLCKWNPLKEYLPKHEEEETN